MGVGVWNVPPCPTQMTSLETWRIIWGEDRKLSNLPTKVIRGNNLCPTAPLFLTILPTLVFISLLCFVLRSELSHPLIMTSDVRKLDNSMRQVLAPQRSACKKTFLKGRRFPSTDGDKEMQRLPWNSSPVRSSDKNLKPRKHCKELTLDIDQPDFICFPCTRILRLGNGRSVDAGENLLCKQNFKTAPWACGQRHQIHVKQCELWGMGSSKIKHDILPNNYRIINADILSPPVPLSPLDAHCRSLLQNKMVVQLL